MNQRLKEAAQALQSDSEQHFHTCFQGTTQKVSVLMHASMVNRPEACRS